MLIQLFHLMNVRPPRVKQNLGFLKIAAVISAISLVLLIDRPAHWHKRT